MKYLKKYVKHFIALAGFIIFGIFVKLLLCNEVSSFDNIVYKYVTYYKNDGLTLFFKIISSLCSTWFIILAVILAIIISKDKKNSLFITTNVIFCCLINQIVKFIFSRSRPIGINLIDEFGYSFPSGHSMVSLAFYGLLIYIIMKKNYSIGKKLLLIIPLVLLIILIGISRIYLGVHYASDVIAGFALSIAYLMLFIIFVYNKNMQFK